MGYRLMAFACVIAGWSALIAPSASAQAIADTILYVGFEWPSVGSHLGDNYDEFFRTPVSQNVMTRQLHVRISRGTKETAIVMLREAGFSVREGPSNPQPGDLTAGTRYALRGRLAEFRLDTRGRTERRVEVTLAISWDLLTLPGGRVVYSGDFRSESETRLDGDRFGSYFVATTQAFEEVVAELRLNEDFVSTLASGGVYGAEEECRVQNSQFYTLHSHCCNSKVSSP